MDEQMNQNGATNNNEAPNNVNDPVANFTKGNNATVMAVLSYIGPLVIVPYLMEKNDEFVKFHVKQGLVVFGIEVIAWVLSSMMLLWMFMWVVNLATLVLSVMGIINVVNGKKAELPVVGSFASKLNI